MIFRRKYSKYYLNKFEIACFLLGWLDLFLRDTIFSHDAIDVEKLKCYSESEPNKEQQSYKDWLLVDTVFFSTRCLRAFLCAQVSSSIQIYAKLIYSCEQISNRILLKSNVDFHCRRCLEKNPVELISIREVEIKPNVKLECVPKFYYLGDLLLQIMLSNIE